MSNDEKNTTAGNARENPKKTKIGTVVSDRMQKTIVVEVERVVPHPLYGKKIKRSNRFKAHVPGKMPKIGDRVKIMEVRPLSADKRWCLVEVMEAAS